MSVRDDDMADGMAPGTDLLDPWTVDRLLDGLIAPEDAPPGYAGVARVVIAARRPASTEELAGMDLAIAAAVSLLRDDGVVDADRIATRMRRTRRLIKAKVGAIVVAGTIVGTSGLAVAGVLPAPIQNAASRVLGRVGVHVPTSGGDLSSSFAIPSPDASPTADASRGHGHDGTPSTSEPRHATGGGSNDPHGQADDPHGQADEPHGQADEPHGQADEPHGQADEPHGQVDQPHGQVDQPHGQADEPHGQVNQPHGQVDQPHGQADDPHGQADEPHGQPDGTGQPGGNGQSDDTHGGGKPADPGSQGSENVPTDPGGGNANPPTHPSKPDHGGGTDSTPSQPPAGPPADPGQGHPPQDGGGNPNDPLA